MFEWITEARNLATLQVSQGCQCPDLHGMNVWLSRERTNGNTAAVEDSSRVRFVFLLGFYHNNSRHLVCSTRVGVDALCVRSLLLFDVRQFVTVPKRTFIRAVGFPLAKV